MWWLAVTVVGFLVLTALIVVLARSATARWERQKRAARAPRAPRAPRAAPTAASLPERASDGARDAVVRWTVTAVHLRTPLPAPLNAVAGLLVSTTRQAAARVRPGRDQLAVAGVPEHQADAPPLVADGSALEESSAPVEDQPRVVRTRRRRALRLLHRQDPGDGAPVARAGDDGSPTAR